jgi:uncharacterized protein
MPAPAPAVDGTPVWIELSCDDLEAAGAFYRDVVGFETGPGSADHGGYAQAFKDGKKVAGLMPRQDPSQPVAWSTYLHTGDADAAVAKARQLGATVVVEPMDVEDLGRMAFVIDPTGAAVGLWQPGTHPGAELVNEPGTWGWAHCNTPDPEAAGAFYREVFGIEVGSMDVGGMDMLALMVDDRPVAGISKPMGGTPGAWWSTDFVVEDCDAATERARAAGATVLVEPFDFPFGRNAVITDPQGAAVGLFSFPRE